MSDAPKDGRANTTAAMEQVLDEQRHRIEQVAKNVIASIKRVIETREKLVPGANATFERLHGEWYRAIERDVVAAREPRHCLVLESAATDGRVIVTASGVAEMGIPIPPSRDVEHFPADTPVAQLVAGHRAHLARTNATLREFAAVQEVLANRLRQANETAEFRRGLGIGILEPVLRAQSHGQFEVKGKPVLEAILAHPEWWTDSPPTAPSIEESDSPR